MAKKETTYLKVVLNYSQEDDYLIIMSTMNMRRDCLEVWKSSVTTYLLWKPKSQRNWVDNRPRGKEKRKYPRQLHKIEVEVSNQVNAYP